MRPNSQAVYLQLWYFVFLFALAALPWQNPASKPVLSFSPGVSGARAVETSMNDHPLIVAHRGARGHAPENTLAAARLAHAEKAEMWELDTAFTKDGHLVVIHDDTLARTTDVEKHPEFAARSPWKVQDFTLAELRTLDAGSWFVEKDPYKTIASGDVTPAMAAAYKGEKIPTLEEALTLTQELNWQVNVEIKDQINAIGHDRIAKEVCALIERLGMKDKVLLSSFQHQYLSEAASYLPEMPRAALIENTRPEDAAAVCKAANAAYYHPKHTLLLPGDTEMLRAEGILANVWTVNSVTDMQRAINLGVNAIITDYPRRLRELLSAQPPSKTPG